MSASLKIRVCQLMYGGGVWSKKLLTAALAEEGYLPGLLNETLVGNLLTKYEGVLFKRLGGQGRSKKHPIYILTDTCRACIATDPDLSDLPKLPPTSWERLLVEGF